MESAHLVDAHCHIDLFERPAEIVAEAERHKVYTIAVTNAPFVFRHTAELVAGCRYVRAAAGMHPELVATHGKQVEMLRPLIKETRYVGEIGLDYTTTDEKARCAQREVLSRILGWCAEDENKILTLHSRRAAADVISAIGDSFACRAILHWFTGSPKEVERAAACGFYFSVNSAMIQSEKGKSLIARMPIERVLTESDGPFVKFSGKVAKLANVGHATEVLSTLWKLSIEETRRTIFENFRSILATG